MQLLNKEIVISDSDIHIKLPFSVPHGQSRLEISFSYHPKLANHNDKALSLLADGVKKYAPMSRVQEFISELPLKNFVTLSLDSPSGYVGAAHRHPNVQKHIVSESESSRGFHSTAIVPGQWVITLSSFFVLGEVTAQVEVVCE